jgi:hypothetical protein
MQSELLQLQRDVAEIKQLAKETYRNTQPAMHWTFAATGAVIVLAAATVAYLQYAPDEYKQWATVAADNVQNEAYTLGRVASDYMQGIDRSYSVPSGNVSMIGLDDVQACRWREALRDRESSNNYQNEGNKYGYFAGYAFGAEALSIVGLVKRSAFADAPPQVKLGTDQTAWLSNPQNWTLPGAKHAFMSSPATQDTAVTQLANLNIKDGFRKRALNKAKPEEIAGFAMAAHLKGLTAALNWYLRGKDDTDANGTKVSDYAHEGEGAISRNLPNCGDGGTVRPLNMLQRMWSAAND